MHASRLPTLVLGRDRLPRTCGSCGSTSLGRELPLGAGNRGMLWCLTCDQSQCWLAAPLTITRRRGCGPLCSQGWGHSAETHEVYGRNAVYAEQARRRRGVVSSGPIVVDFDAARVLLADQPVHVSPREYTLLAYLADRVGECCRHADISAAVWDVTTAELWATSSRRWHCLRVAIVRLRARLGPAAAFVETVQGLGYRLRADPFGAATEEATS